MVNNLKLVRCEKKYWEFVRILRNKYRKSFGNQETISKKKHLDFMLKNAYNYYICLRGGVPVGFIGVVSGDIRVAVEKKYRGSGIGKFMLNEIIKLHPDSFAKVKINNINSLALFESCGFEKKYYLLEQ
jgi:GNAT superfamily N-acetyltransferase